MRFAQHLSSHLTPEWRKNYIDYDLLKKLVYDVATACERRRKATAATLEEKLKEEEEDEEEARDELTTNEEDEFFNEIQRQFDLINNFYRMLEAKLSSKLQQLTEEVDVLVQAQTNFRTRKIRSTRRKRESLKAALCEFYYHLTLLQNFQVLNFTGLRKILKKFDKLASSERGGRYHKRVVCKSYFHTSDEVNKMILITEGLMIDKIEYGNRSKAMSKLRVPPLGTQSLDWSSLIGGWLMGIIFVCLLVAFVMLGIRLRDDPDWSPSADVLSGLRAPFLLALWFYAFSINTFGWRRGGVNNVLIFEFNPRNYLSYVQLAELSSLLGVISCLGLLLFLSSGWLNIPDYVGPVFSLVFIIIFFLLPLPILFHHSRWWLFKRIGRVILAPFFKVEFADFWIADQFNSLTIFLLDVERFFCYLVYGQIQESIVGSGATAAPCIRCGTPSYGLRSIVAVLPAWWRFAQCLRRYRDALRDPLQRRYRYQHLTNAGKYSTTFFVVFFSSLASSIHDPSTDEQSAGYYITLVLWMISGIVSTCYTFTWDIHMDWGLFHNHQCLRKELIYPYQIYYVLAVVEDFILRILWAPSISVGEGGFNLLNGQVLTTIVASLEVFRRFIWNFFRLENEHLNNCGKFRAVRDISIHPLDLDEVTAQDDADDEAGGFLYSIRRSSIVRRASVLWHSENNNVEILAPNLVINDRITAVTNVMEKTNTNNSCSDVQVDIEMPSLPITIEEDHND